jgi:hypothetical protein
MTGVKGRCPWTKFTGIRRPRYRQELGIRERGGEFGGSGAAALAYRFRGAIATAVAGVQRGERRKREGLLARVLSQRHPQRAHAADCCHPGRWAAVACIQ